MKEKFLNEMIASPRKEVVVNVTTNTRKAISQLLGISRRDIKYEQVVENTLWDIKIKGFESLNMRVHQSGAIEISTKKDDKGANIYEIVRNADQIVEPFQKIQNKNNKYTNKINKDGFDPTLSIVNQLKFKKEEIKNKKQKSFSQMLKEKARIFTREMMEDQNLKAFLVGGVGVALLHYISINPEATVALKNVISFVTRWSSVATSALVGLHPTLYYFETKFGNIQDRKSAKLYKGAREFANFVTMGGIGFTVGDVAINTTESLLDSNSIGIEASHKANLVLETKQETIIPQVENPNVDVQEIPQNTDSINEIEVLKPSTDVEATKMLDDYYESVLSDKDWTNNIDNNGIELSDVLLDKTLEYLARNLAEKGLTIHDLDLNDFFDKPEKYLNEDQIANLKGISQTNSVVEYIDYLKSH